MPNWQPNWENVVWDWGAANEAIAALQRTADQLENSLAERRPVATAAQVEWRGRFRDEFDQELERIVQRALSLAAEYRATAARIAAASAGARAEQDHRERERDRWQREKADEERRERERREREEREHRRK